MTKTSWWLGVLALLSMSEGYALNQEIRALFQPDSSQPHKNIFVNKTPNSGYCTLDPAQCTDNNMFSIELPVRFDSSRPIIPGAPADAMMIKVPSNWRQLTVVNSETGESEIVEVRIIGIGSKYVLPTSAAELVGVTDILEGHQRLWSNSSWVYAPPPCQYSGVGWYSPNTYRFFWKAPVETWCTKVAQYRVPSMSFDKLDFAYELRTPNPLSMSSGIYTGSLTYTLGPGGDFQMGAMMIPDDTSLTLDFVLDVQHTLKVDLPPGGNRIALEPEGGWKRWLNSRQLPGRLFRDQTFHISASSRFKMFLECAQGTPSNCYLYNEANTMAAPLNVSVSLPGGLTDVSGKPVNRQRLAPLGGNAIIFYPGAYVDRQQGTMHFDIDDKTVIERMLTLDQGYKYSNLIVVVFDSEI
ncbi:hypothetical protein [Pseudomonas sp. COW5]|uniref:hypothetical protein n=1 Tax=Pseudomonas sp. COW5 TaxID=2981253 RepID=UPI0022471FC7|nr:hypothetical protein [Pseudomonas sp. COW5]MCX2544563.1 hypothetical protein [Pseudomonas sp. COW5]